mmetsp:Transcript_79726/g.161526  ORF Transcript_79726/g.161526 Transcript_79726/m.161526 type:complete len:216 (+) Transcript_79726:356-1003(+)
MFGNNEDSPGGEGHFLRPPRRHSLTERTDPSRQRKRLLRRRSPLAGSMPSCFRISTLPATTVFGRTGRRPSAEHWDSFQSRYSPESQSRRDRWLSRLFRRAQRCGHRRRHRRSRSNHTLSGRDSDPNDHECPPPRGRCRLLWLLVGCWVARSSLSSSPPGRARNKAGSRDLDRNSDSNGDSDNDSDDCDCDRDAWMKKRIPLVERYSDYFERRRT